jgi:hypothetical protein
MAGTCRIVAGVSGSPGSVHALRHTAGLARHHDATLIPLLAWMAPGGNLSERNDPCPSYASYGKTRPGSGYGTPSTPRSVACPPCCAASPARRLHSWPASRATCWSSALGARARCGSWEVSQSAGTAWPTPVARCWPSPPALAQQAGYGLRGWAFRHRWTQATTHPI